MNRRARHPVREGKVVCSDCHNPHGSPGPRQLVKNSVTETCYQCHAEKRGPYLWEHQPVREDCTNCHNPHGSNQFRMLKVRQPFLCQECHGEAYHPATFYSGDDIPPAASPAQQVVGRSCTNCHSVIHGSNHPSGSRFTR
jgi:DmsE family decaheme c-type cytochrome